MLYTQPEKEQFINEMIRDGVMNPDRTVVDKNKYMHWLEQKRHAIIHELATQFPEFGDYDKYAYDLKIKELDLVQQMIMNIKSPTPSVAQQKLDNRENELLNRPSVFTQAIKLINEWKQSRPGLISRKRENR